MPITGGCLCGALRYAVSSEPLWSCYCHCESCRRHSGAPVTAYVGFRATDVEISGTLGRHASSPGVIRSFCPTCGTPLSYEADTDPGEWHFYLNTLDDPEAHPPSAHVFYAEHLTFFEVNDALPRYAGRGGSGAPASWGPRRQS